MTLYMYDMSKHTRYILAKVKIYKIHTYSHLHKVNVTQVVQNH